MLLKLQKSYKLLKKIEVGTQFMLMADFRMTLIDATIKSHYDIQKVEAYKRIYWAKCGTWLSMEGLRYICNWMGNSDSLLLGAYMRIIQTRERSQNCHSRVDYSEVRWSIC